MRAFVWLRAAQLRVGAPFRVLHTARVPSAQLWLFGLALLIDRMRALGRRLPCIAPPADTLDLRLPSAKLEAAGLNEPLLPLHAATSASESAFAQGHDASAAVEDDDVRAERARIGAGVCAARTRAAAAGECDASQP